MTSLVADGQRLIAYAVTPNDVDASLALEVLAQAGIQARAFATLSEAAAAVHELPGCLIVVEEALIAEDLAHLGEALADLPHWCDLPLLFVAREVDSVLGVVTQAFPHAGNVTYLERPLNPSSFSSAVAVAIRASERQRHIGALLDEREQSIRRRDEFLAMLAHELRNPLAPMRNAVYVMRRVKLQEPVMVQTVEVLDRQITHVARLVDDLMDVARLEQGKLVLQRAVVDLNKIAAAALETSLHAAQARRHRIEAKFDPRPLMIDADPVRMEQIISNLLGNAIKFSPEPGEIIIETREDAGVGQVAVKDSGMGFKPEAAELLFEPFFQGQSTLARSTGGLGMGLAIVRRLVALHGGTVTGESDGPGKGARFVVRLPLVSGGSAPREPERAEVTSRSLRVAVIEDHPDVRDTLETILRMWGHQVLIAADGRAGLALVLRERPDVAVVDIGLPGMSGYEVASAVRAALPDARIRLIAVSGYGQPADVEMARNVGFDAHLLKPVAPTELFRMLE